MSRFQVFLTRPEGRNGSVPDQLKAQGMGVIELPALTLRPTPNAAPLPLPDQYDVIVFVSRYAAHRYLSLLAQKYPRMATWPRHTVAATVGASSARALLSRSFHFRVRSVSATETGFIGALAPTCKRGT